MTKLPQKILVQVKRNRNTGVFIAELPEYDVFTEADDFNSLIFQVNDLICTYFSVPKSSHDKVFYIPAKVTSLIEKQEPPVDPILFHILTSNSFSSCLNGKI